MNKPNITLSSVVTLNNRNLIKLSRQRMAAAKRSFVTRNVPVEELYYLSSGDVKPVSGDLILARVDLLGQQQHIELPCGRLAQLFPGDEIILSYGNGYAPDQFLGHVPESLGPCSLLTAGGIAGEMISQHADMKNATRITPLGLLAGADRQIMNLRSWGLTETSAGCSFPTVLAVVGSSLHVGKTRTSTCLVHGLVKAGLSVGAAKITGTGASGDFWRLRDSGAWPVIDFTDMGLPSTYKADILDIESVMQRQFNHLCREGVDIIVLELGDGLSQAESRALLEGMTFNSMVDGIFLAASQAMCLQSSVDWILERELPLLGISGSLTNSPLLLEETRQKCTVPVFSMEELDCADFYPHLMALCSLYDDINISKFQ